VLCVCFCGLQQRRRLLFHRPTAVCVHFQWQVWQPTLWSFSFDKEFLTHVFMCHRQEKLRSHAAVFTGNAIAITPILYSTGNASLYRSRQEINANIFFGFSTESSRSTSRFAWWSSWLKSVSFAPYALANGFKAIKSANLSLVGLEAWMPINTLQWLSVKGRSISLSKLSKTA